MSTTIDHGYRLPIDTDVFAFCDRVRAVMNPIRDRLDVDEICRRAVALRDDTLYLGRRPKRTGLNFYPWLTATLDYRDEQEKLNPRILGQDPHRFGLSLQADTPTSSILVLLYTDRVDYTEAWEAMPEVSRYGYWNNSDRDQSVTESEWSERRDAWDRVMPRGVVPAEAMLSFDLRPTAAPGWHLVSMDGQATCADLIASALAEQTPTTRARRIVHDLTTSAVLTADSDGAHQDNLWRLLRTVRDNQTAATIAADLATDLEPLTPEDLTTSPGEPTAGHVRVLQQILNRVNAAVPEIVAVLQETS